MTGVNRYLAETLMPVDGLPRTNKVNSDFPEKISSSQLLTASYFFKFITLFPAFYLFLFLGFVLAPDRMTGGSLSATARVALTLSGLGFLWVWAGAKRCMMLQREAYTARRICSRHPWPNFPDREVRDNATVWRKRIWFAVAFVTVPLIIANGVWGYFILNANASNLWSRLDFALAGATAGVLGVAFLFTEWDIRKRMEIAKELNNIARTEIDEN